MDNHHGLRTRQFFHRLHQQEVESPAEIRNVLLIIATLIAAVTFQAGINPPGGVWQDDQETHDAGRAIYASNPFAYYVFLISNTFALSTSILIIVILTHKFPFRVEIFLATITMIITYASAIFAVTPRDHVRFRYVFLAGFMPFLVRGIIQIGRACKSS